MSCCSISNDSGEGEDGPPTSSASMLVAEEEPALERAARVNDRASWSLTAPTDPVRRCCRACDAGR